MTMIASMTAFARGTNQGEWGYAIWEVRSVNHRYLDLSFRLPEPFREWEHAWRRTVAKKVSRGKIECFLTFTPSQQTIPPLKLNIELTEQLIANCQTIMQYPGVKPSMRAMDLLAWPNVLTTDVPNIAPLQAPLTDLLTRTIEDLVKMRESEGEQIKILLKAKLEHVLAQLTLIREKFPVCIKAQKQKLIQKLNEFQVTGDPQRLEQELVYYAQRIDIEEEIERLQTHVKEVNRVLDQGEAMGRRLDFLMQEMGREANTLAAKSSDASVVQAAIELKVLIEQMREQIQNVE